MFCYRCGEDEFTSEFSLFEALRETIYSEVATLISQNESRPHYLIQMFRELQLLNSDYLRQRFLYSVEQLVTRYLTDDASADAGQQAGDVMRHRGGANSRDAQTTTASSPPVATHWSSAALDRGMTSEMTPSVSMSTFDEEDIKVLRVMYTYMAFRS